MKFPTFALPLESIGTQMDPRREILEWSEQYNYIPWNFFFRWPPVSRAPARTRRPRWMFDGKYPEAGGAVYKRGQGQSGSSIDYLRFVSQIIASNACDDYLLLARMGAVRMRWLGHRRQGLSALHGRRLHLCPRRIPSACSKDRTLTSNARSGCHLWRIGLRCPAQRRLPP